MVRGNTNASECSFGFIIHIQYTHLSVCSGPGSYNVFEDGLGQESFKKAFLARTRKGGFGSTAQRNFIFNNKESIDAPSPGQYEVRRTTDTVIFSLT